MNATTQIDIYDVVGTWRDSCEFWQIANILPGLQVLFGAVTWRVRGTQTMPAQSFADWLESV